VDAAEGGEIIARPKKKGLGGAAQKAMRDSKKQNNERKTQQHSIGVEGGEKEKQSGKRQIEIRGEEKGKMWPKPRGKSNSAQNGAKTQTERGNGDIS